MLKKHTYFLIGFLAASANCIWAYAIEWPILDSWDSQKPLHKKILSSILGRPGEKYRGGKFKGNFFVIQGNGVDREKNRELIDALPFLRTSLKEGHRLELHHISSEAKVANFTKHCLYKLAVDSKDTGFRFSLYNRENLKGFTPFPIPAEEKVASLPTHQPSPWFKGIAPVHVGYGVRTNSALPDQEIKKLITKYKNHPILGKALKIIEGADLAVAHDQKVLLNNIRSLRNNDINIDDLFNLMKKDRDLITQAANKLDRRKDPVTLYLPFLDQLHALGNQGAICGRKYVGRKGIDAAITLIEKNPKLLHGIVLQRLQNLAGKDAIDLRIALFYIALAKKKAAGQSFGPSHLITFYKGNYFGHNKEVKELLSQTSFFQDGYFYAPDNGYIKSADTVVSIPHDFQDLRLAVDEDRPLDNLNMIFTDCSGFAQHVVRQFHPSHARLQERVMTYHLAAIYDVLMNERMGTKNWLYDLSGEKKRPLNEHEKKKIEKYKGTIEDLKSVYEPVLNPKKNMLPGDLLIRRSATTDAEGHVMMIVEQAPSHVIIVELTGSEKSRGYRWKAITPKDTVNDIVYHVLRIKR